MLVAEPGLAHYLHVLRRGAWIIVLTAAVFAGAALFFSTRQTALYRSSADVFLGSQNLAATLSNVQVPTGDPIRAAATQADLARTPQVATAALRIAQLPHRSAQSLLSGSSVNPATNADILTFSVSDHVPAVAERLANAYATAYTRYRHRVDTGAIVKARQGIEAQLAQLKAAGESQSSVYANLFEKDQELGTLQALQGSNALVVRSATQAVQTQPRPLRNAVLAGILGLFVGAGLAFLREALSTRIRTPAEIQSLLDLPQLGSLPEPPRRLRVGNELVMLTEPLNPVAEPFRILATNLDFVNLEHNARTIMFTSATRGEGKSTTVSNVALAFARSGRRVILVDFDVRKPSVSGLFALGERPGLTNVLLGHLSLDEALTPISLISPAEDSDGTGSGLLASSTTGAVEVLPVGPIPPNPAEFVALEAVSVLLEELTHRADLVLVDAPPFLNLSDAMTLSSNVDGLVVVARLTSAKRPVLLDLNRALSAIPTPKLGFVVTGAEAGDTYGAYGYGHAATRGRSETRV